MRSAFKTLSNIYKVEHFVKNISGGNPEPTLEELKETSRTQDLLNPTEMYYCTIFEYFILPA